MCGLAPSGHLRLGRAAAARAIGPRDWASTRRRGQDSVVACQPLHPDTMQLGLILLCLAFPLLELAVMIKVGQSIGVLWTLLALVGIGVAGGLIVRAQGFAAMGRAFEAARGGRPPIEPVVDSMFLMLAGVLFLIPGFITDVAGALLLIPPLRRSFARWAFRRMMAGGTFTASTVRTGSRPEHARSPENDAREPADEMGGQASRRPQADPRTPGRNQAGRNQSGRDQSGVVIEGEWERVDEPDKRPPGNPPGSPPRPS